MYATLDLLADLGLIRRVEAGPGPALYDARTEPHHHTICQRCGEVEDLDTPADFSVLERAARTVGFAPTQTDVVVSGLCGNCSAERI